MGDFNGVMRDFVTTLSPAQESLRVPLIPCVSQRAGGEVDVCCRDPNYKDPWPEQEQAREESRALDGGDQWRLQRLSSLLLVYFLNSVNIKYVHFQNCLNFQME